MKKKLCLHLACGTVFLLPTMEKKWVNIDVDIPGSYLAEDRPDIVKRNSTTVDNYYKQEVKRDQFLSKELQKKDVVCDVFSDITDLPYEKDSVDEILAVQVFEHFSFTEGREVMKYWTGLLKKGGILHLDVPDLDGTVKIYLKDKEWGTRLLFGSQKNEYGVHKSMYTRKTLKKLFKDFGYTDIEVLPNIHTYPGFAVRGIKG